jgi:predicted metal-dependent enzyme (double-stranded beta helix superfamily)
MGKISAQPTDPHLALDSIDGDHSHLARRAGGASGPSPLPFDALKAIVAGLAQTAPKADHRWTDDPGRRYARLLETSTYDAWLIVWSPSSRVDLHDHGGSEGALVVATGRLIETYVDLAGRHPVHSRVVNAGDAIAIPATRVHQVSNPWPGEAVSVHVYSPPLAAMTIFDLSPSGSLTLAPRTDGDLVALAEAAGVTAAIEPGDAPHSVRRDLTPTR